MEEALRGERDFEISIEREKDDERTAYSSSREYSTAEPSCTEFTAFWSFVQVSSLKLSGILGASGSLKSKRGERRGQQVLER